MVPPERIKLFVQNILGCGCPEEVFRSIDVRERVALNRFIVLDHAIIIGNRLLVYVAKAGSDGCIEEHLPILVGMGKNERDAKGLNRFRLVLVSDTPDEVRETAERQFKKLRGNDEKVHLHVISKIEMPFATESTEGTE